MEIRPIDVCYAIIVSVCTFLWLSRSIQLLAHRRTASRSAVYICAFLFFYIFIFGMQTRPVYLQVDKWIGQNNFSWYVSYMASHAAIYFLLLTARSLDSKDPKLTDHIGIVVASTIITWLYVVHIRFDPESLQRYEALNAPQLYFILTSHVYCAGVHLISLWIFVRKIASDVAGRTRMLAFAWGIIWTEIWIASRALHVLFGYMGRDFPYSQRFSGIVLILLSVGMSWSLAHNRFHERIVSKLHVWGNRFAALQIDKLISYCLRYSVGRTPTVTLSESIRGAYPDLYAINQIVFLCDYVRLVEDKEIHPRAEVLPLYERLRELPDSYDEAINRCLRLSLNWQLRTRLGLRFE